MKPANKSEHRLLQSSTLLLSLIGRILKMWVCKIQDLKIIALNIFPKIKQLLTYFFKKQIRSPSQWQLSDSCLSLLCSDSTTFLGMRFKDIRTMTTCPIIAKYKNNWHICEYVIVFRKAKPKKNQCLFIVRRCLHAPEKVLLWVLKKKREIQGPLQIRLNWKFSVQSGGHLINNK